MQVSAREDQEALEVVMTVFTELTSCYNRLAIT